MRKAMRLIAAAAVAIIALIPVSAFCEGFDYNHYEDIGIYVMEAVSLKPLIAKNEDKPYEPASTAKVLAAITAIECLEPDDPVIYTQDIKDTVYRDSSLADLKVGETLTFEQSIYAMLLPSGNDAARAVSVAAAKKKFNNPSLPAKEAMSMFAGLMNEKAKAIGMYSSYFTNADGYPGEGTYSTAKDLAMLGAFALGYKEIALAAKTLDYEAATNMGRHVWSNTNMLLYPTLDQFRNSGYSGINPYYSPNILGLKTGTAGGSMGRSFLYAQQEGEMLVVGALMHVNSQMSETIWTASSNSLKYSFEAYELLDLITESNREVSLKVTNHAILENAEIKLVAFRPITVCIEKEQVPNVKFELVPNSEICTFASPGKLKAKDDIMPGDIVARGVFTLEGAYIAAVDFISPESYSKLGMLDLACASGAGVIVLAVGARAIGGKVKRSLPKRGQQNI